MMKKATSFFCGVIAGVLVTALLGGTIMTLHAQLTSRHIEVLTGVNIVVDGVPFTPRDHYGNLIETFTFNGNTYVPSEEIARIWNKGVNWVPETLTLFLGSADNVPPPMAGMPPDHGQAPPADPPAQQLPPGQHTPAQQTAVAIAQDYLAIFPYSREGLIRQLGYEFIPRDVAVLAIDGLGVNWNEQATRFAEMFAGLPMTRDQVIAELLSEGFTQEEAAFGVQSAGII